MAGIMDAINAIRGNMESRWNEEQGKKVAPKQKTVYRNRPNTSGAYSYSSPLDMEPMSNEVFEGLRDRKLLGLESQRKGYGDLERQLAEYRDKMEAQPAGMNLTGLLKAADMITGSDYSKGYKAPKSKSEKELELLQMDATMNKLAGGLTKSEIDFMKAQFQPKGGTVRESWGKPVGSGSGSGKGGKAHQYLAASYGRRVEQAEKVFNNLEEAGYDRTGGWEAAKGILPGFMGSLKGEDLLRQEQAERNFLNAILRRESGAVISPTEFSSGERQYFPRMGDTPKVLAAKRANRENSLKALRAEAGNVWNEVDATSPLSKYKGMEKSEQDVGWRESILGRPSPAKPQSKPAAPRRRAAPAARKQMSFEQWKKAKGM